MLMNAAYRHAWMRLTLSYTKRFLSYGCQTWSPTVRERPT